MNQTHLKYHSQIPRKGIYYNSVKLLLASSIFFMLLFIQRCELASHYGSFDYSQHMFRFSFIEYEK